MPLHAQDPPHPLLRSHALLKVTSVSRPQTYNHNSPWDLLLITLQCVPCTPGPGHVSPSPFCLP
ncbi:hypothetical protein FKM82_016353 [Ascaphus truei]